MLQKKGLSYINTIIKHMLLQGFIVTTLTILGFIGVEMYIYVMAGAIGDGLYMYVLHLSLILGVMVYENKYLQDKGFKFIERGCIQLGVSIILLYALSLSPLFPFLMLVNYIFAETIFIVGKRLGRSLTNKTFKKMGISWFCVFLLCSLLVIIDFDTSEAYGVEEISNLQAGLLIDVDNKATSLVGTEDVVFADKERLSEEEILDLISKYMQGEFKCKSYSIGVSNLNLMYDKVTEEYFYTAYVRGKVVLGEEKLLGLVLRADTGVLCYVEDIYDTNAKLEVK